MNGTYAIVFPGQGSQSVGMLNELSQHYPIIEETFAQASDALGYDLWQLTQEGPAEKLDQTQFTQPALLTASYALWRVLQSQQLAAPAKLAGHSLGEYTALVCADSLSFTDAVKLVAARGQFMQEAVQPGEGAMAAIIGLPEAEVEAMCAQEATASETVSPANYNSIGQVVIAGHSAAVEKVMALAKGKGAKLVVKIPVSVPSHCALMKPAAERLQVLLNETVFQTPRIPVINNVDVLPYTDANSIKTGLAQQLSKPVRWVETIQSFAAAGIDTVIECGPGKILTGLHKRIDKSLKLIVASDFESLQTLAKVG